MSALTKNLFWGRGPGDHNLDVVEGHWPNDMAGSVFVVGPDKRRPGGHWFDQQGLLLQIALQPNAAGQVNVRLAKVATPLSKIQQRLPRLFATLNFMVLSPFGLSNLANTNVAGINGRLFIGYDAGRPLEVDPDTLEVLTPVGGNEEWYQGSPGLMEPGVSVAAHPAVDFEEDALYFVNYSPMPVDETFIARWSLDGKIERWRVRGMSEFDSIHDIKATRDYLVFTELPFTVEPGTFVGKQPTHPTRDDTLMWIIAKSDLRATPIGGTVHAKEIRVPMPSGHLSVDYDNANDTIRVYLEHVAIQDLMIRLTTDERSHRTGAFFDPNYEGLVSIGLQPGAVGRYDIDASTGTVTNSDLAWDDRFWGAVLATKDEYSAEAREHQGQLWYSGMGFDPDFVSETWWKLYADAGLHALVDPHELPEKVRPGALARFDRDSMKVAEVYEFEPGTFPHPPTFVRRSGADDTDDGYIVTVVHCDGPKQVWVFDANHIEQGPLARATAPAFNPPLMLHSCWLPPHRGAPRPAYRIPLWRDVLAAVTALPGHLLRMVKMGPQLKEMAERSRPPA